MNLFYKRLAIILPIFCTALLLLPSASFGGDPISTGNGYFYQEFVTTTNVSAGTNYYPSRQGKLFNPSKSLSWEIDVSGGVTATFEVFKGFDTRLVSAAAVGTTVLKVKSVDGFVAGQVISIGTGTSTRTISRVDSLNKWLIVSVALGGAFGSGAVILTSDVWHDATVDGFDGVNNTYANATYVDITTFVDFAGLNARRFRIKSVTSDGTNSVNYKVASNEFALRPPVSEVTIDSATPIDVTESEPVFAQAVTSIAASVQGVAAATNYYPAFNGFTLTEQTGFSASIDVNTGTQTVTVECTNSASFWNGAIIDVTKAILDLSANTVGNTSFTADAFLHTENLTAARCRFKVVTTSTGNNITIELKKRY